MPNILTFDGAGQCTGWHRSVSQDRYGDWPDVVECAVRPTVAHGKIVHDAATPAGWRAKTNGELAQEAAAAEAARLAALRSAIRPISDILRAANAGRPENAAAAVQALLADADATRGVQRAVRLLTALIALQNRGGSWTDVLAVAAQQLTPTPGDPNP